MLHKLISKIASSIFYDPLFTLIFTAFINNYDTKKD